MRNEVKLANPNYDSSKIEEFKNVWVFCEQRQGQMMSTSYELSSEGRKLADELGVKLCGLLVGDNVGDLAESIGGYGADEVIVCDHPLLREPPPPPSTPALSRPIPPFTRRLTRT